MGYIIVGNGHLCNVVCEANIILCESTTGNSIKMTTLVVPGFTKNILSMKRLMSVGYDIKAKRRQVNNQRLSRKHFVHM
jgi:hypothetical protein